MECFPNKRTKKSGQALPSRNVGLKGLVGAFDTTTVFVLLMGKNKPPKKERIMDAD